MKTKKETDWEKRLKVITKTNNQIENRRQQMINDPRVRNVEGNESLTVYGKRLTRFYETLSDEVWGIMLSKRWLTNCYMKSRDYINAKERIERVDKYEKANRLMNKQWAEYLKRNNSISGYVYILGNPGMPGHFKIGGTTDKPEERADNLYSQGKTAVPARFSVEYKRMTFDCWGAENYIHNELYLERINTEREFFKIQLGKAKTKVDELITEYELFRYKHFNR